VKWLPFRLHRENQAAKKKNLSGRHYGGVALCQSKGSMVVQSYRKFGIESSFSGTAPENRLFSTFLCIRSSMRHAM
jgi:hypothetical protein